MDIAVLYRIAEASEMTDIERLSNLYASLMGIFDYRIDGAIVELGCNAGHTAAFLQLLNVDQAQNGGALCEVHVYDSFQGLSAPGVHDEFFAEGAMATTIETLRKTFRAWGAPLPQIHAGWFQETLNDLPERIAFAYLDSDYYESIKDSLKAVVPRLSPGGVVIVDDYCDRTQAPNAWNLLPGVKLACDEFFESHGGQMKALPGIGELAFGFYREPLGSATP